MKKIKLVLLSILVICGFCIMPKCSQKDIYAGQKAVKVKKSYKKRKNGKNYTVISGYTKKNKKVWSHMAKTYGGSSQIDPITYKKRKNKVYFFDGNKLKIYRLSNGKKIKQFKVKIYAGHSFDFDSKGNMYLTGYCYDEIYKINSNGKTIWKSSVANLDVGDAYGLKYKKGKVTVYYESGAYGDLDMDHTYYVRFDAANGKIVDYND